MKMTVPQGTSPEEEELAARRAELKWLETELVKQELRLSDRKAEIAAFEERYLRELGTLKAQLAEWKTRLANRPAAEFGLSGAGAPPCSPPPEGESGSDSTSRDEVVGDDSASHLHDLKRLYREAAKLVHPDTAASESERAARERSMKEVNAAYLAGDEKMLRRILLESQFSPDAVEGDGVAANLIRALRRIRMVQNRISAIEQETVELSRSELSQLKTKADIAAREGRDLLTEMAVRIQGQLDGIRRGYGLPPAPGR